MILLDMLITFYLQREKINTRKKKQWWLRRGRRSELHSDGFICGEVARERSSRIRGNRSVESHGEFSITDSYQ